ncbi:MAG: helix-turn-helix transcriptional regulator [Planctomycetota bacterium]|nr:helix-turn-helix transcriptional regulator [Planctomycetota bacterium]
MKRAPTAVKVAKAVAARLRQKREERGWSQEELGRNARIHRTYIGAIERGEKNLTVMTLYRLAQAFGCPVSALLPEEP